MKHGKSGAAQLNLPQLKAELIAAGFNIEALGADNTDVYTYDAKGVPAELPRVAQAVVDAHVAKPVVDRRAALRDEFNAAMNDRERIETLAKAAGLRD